MPVLITRPARDSPSPKGREGVTCTPLELPVEEIAAYVSGQGNLGNAKHVLSVTLEAPSARLEGGIRLVATPGRGGACVSFSAERERWSPDAVT